MPKGASQYLISVRKPTSRQSDDVLSFVGGVPRLPASLELPTCKLCESSLSFFFQVAFPAWHRWHGFSMAVFECTSRSHDRHMIPFINRSFFPTMPKEYLEKGDDLPDGSLDAYQKNFRLPVFRTDEGSPRVDYEERVRFMPIEFIPAAGRLPVEQSSIGGRPRWLVGAGPGVNDQTPGAYLGEPLSFLLQWGGNQDFATIRGAPSQFSHLSAAFPELLDCGYYDLFVGYQLYFFGNMAEGRPNVYVVGQKL